MQLANPKIKEISLFVKFTLFSASAGLIQVFIFYLLNLIPTLGYWVCYLAALIASILWNFTLNRKFTFKSATNIPIAMFKTFCYYIVFTPISTIVGDYLVKETFSAFAGAKDIIFFSTLLINFISEFLYQRFYVFKNKIDER